MFIDSVAKCRASGYFQSKGKDKGYPCRFPPFWFSVYLNDFCHWVADIIQLKITDCMVGRKIKNQCYFCYFSFVVSFVTLSSILTVGKFSFSLCPSHKHTYTRLVSWNEARIGFQKRQWQNLALSDLSMCGEDMQKSPVLSMEDGRRSKFRHINTPWQPMVAPQLTSFHNCLQQLVKKPPCHSAIAANGATI